jgi:hypothetical protein
MSKSFLLILSTIAALNGFPQKEKVNSLVISTPIIFNNSEATFYRLGWSQNPSGNGISYGLNVGYERSMLHNVYLIVGIGYFRQSFAISRPFDVRLVTAALYHTESYHYHSVHYFGGIGYRNRLSDAIVGKGEIVYNQLQSFRQ